MYQNTENSKQSFVEHVLLPFLIESSQTKHWEGIIFPSDYFPLIAQNWTTPFESLHHVRDTVLDTISLKYN